MGVYDKLSDLREQLTQLRTTAQGISSENGMTRQIVSRLLSDFAKEKRMKNLERRKWEKEYVLRINIAELVPIERYFTANLGLYTNGRRMLRGCFRKRGTRTTTTEEFSCPNVGGDAEKSYRAAIMYFNFTLRPGETAREAVWAEWVREEK